MRSRLAGGYKETTPRARHPFYRATSWKIPTHGAEGILSFFPRKNEIDFLSGLALRRYKRKVSNSNLLGNRFPATAGKEIPQASGISRKHSSDLRPSTTASEFRSWEFRQK
jgi:hypothetical protein